MPNGVPTDIATEIGNGNVYYLGTDTNYDLSVLAPEEYENFTTDNFICLITKCSPNSIKIADHSAATSCSITVNNPSIRPSYSPSTR